MRPTLEADAATTNNFAATVVATNVTATNAVAINTITINAAATNDAWVQRHAVTVGNGIKLAGKQRSDSGVAYVTQLNTDGTFDVCWVLSPLRGRT